MFSVLILTLNEERNLPRCLESVKEIDDVVVLDSGSTDRTVEIARNAGARIFRRPFDDFAGQRNFAQQHIEFRHRWVFHLDADETMTPALARECSAATIQQQVDGFFVAPKMIFQGRWIRHCTDYPAYQARFVRAPEFRFVQVGHGQREAPGQRLGTLSESYHHYLPDSASEWLDKHRRYAHDEAQERARSRTTNDEWRKLLAAEPLERRRTLKRLSHALPLRGASRFVYQYLFRGGFLDGQPGLVYCRRLAQYESLITKELRILAHR
jgi:glycosyltransferase involved in cell wall biosynthesis